MRGILLTLFVTFYGTPLIQRILCQQDEFRAFLLNSANEFPSWIAKNGLDPTPGSPSELNLAHSEGRVNITRLRIWNEIATGYSSSVISSVDGDLVLADFIVRVFLDALFNVTAEYEVEGTVLSSAPITGAGKVFTERVNNYQYIDLIVSGFKITPDGYINMSAGSVSTYFEIYDLYNPSFEDLSAGGFEEEVSRILRKLYSDWSMNYVGEYLRLYFEELFAKTPLSEIIGTTYPPPTTTAPPEETTAPMSTTTEAPPCQIFQEDGFTFVEGNVIKNVTVNENGEKEEFVKKVVVFKRKL